MSTVNKPLRYRRKPIILEAILVTSSLDNHKAIQQWIFDSEGVDKRLVMDKVSFGSFIIIHTFEGTKVANVGDYVVRGVRGDFFRCEPDLFENTYEEVNAHGDRFPAYTQ